MEAYLLLIGAKENGVIELLLDLETEKALF